MCSESSARDPLPEAVAELTSRVRELEDRLAIYQLVASYGPAVDSESGPAVAALWSEDGVYDPGGVPAYTGRADVGALVDGPLHQRYLRSGCAHVLSLPVVRVDGDTAVAVNHSRVYLHETDHWRLERVSANRWELRRVDGRWQVVRRANRLLDGATEPRALLRRDPPDG